MFALLQSKHLDVAGKLDYHCGSASGKVRFRYTAFRQCPRYREKTEERVMICHSESYSRQLGGSMLLHNKEEEEHMPAASGCLAGRRAGGG